MWQAVVPLQLSVEDKRGCYPSLYQVGDSNCRILSALRKDGDSSNPAVPVSLQQCSSLLHPPNFFFSWLGVNMGHIVFCLPLPCPAGCVSVAGIAEMKHEWSVLLSPQCRRWDGTGGQLPRPALTTHRLLTDSSPSVHLTPPPSSPKSHSINCVRCYLFSRGHFKTTAANCFFFFLD